MPMSFKVNQKTDTLYLSGEMTLKSLMRVEPDIKRLLNQTEIMKLKKIDLSAIAQIDSLAWAWLLRLQLKMSEPLILIALPEKLKVLAKLYDLDNIFHYQ